MSETLSNEARFQLVLCIELLVKGCCMCQKTGHRKRKSRHRARTDGDGLIVTATDLKWHYADGKHEV